MSWLRIRELVRKEFIQLFRDQKKQAHSDHRADRPAPGLRIRGELRHQGHPRRLSRSVPHAGKPDAHRCLQRQQDFQHYPSSPKTAGTGQLSCSRERSIWPSRSAPISAEHIRKGETADIQILADGSMSNMASVRIAYTVRSSTG